MDFGVLAIAGLVLIVVFIAHKMFSEAFDLVHLMFSIVGILLVVGVGLIVFDAVSFKNSLSSSKVLVVKLDEGSVVAADVVGPKGSVSALSDFELANMTGYLASHQYEEVLQGYSRIFIVDAKVEGVRPSAVLASLLNSPTVFVKEYKSGNVDVYPETPLFFAARRLPLLNLGFAINPGDFLKNVTI